MRNKYDREDRIIAYTMYRNKALEIGLWDIKRIAEVTGHSAESFDMKVNQFKGLASNRRPHFIDDGRDDYRPGLNAFNKVDAAIWNEYKDTNLLNLNFLAKLILKEKFGTYQNHINLEKSKAKYQHVKREDRFYSERENA
jgi:hypothetical protein